MVLYKKIMPQVIQEVYLTTDLSGVEASKKLGVSYSTFKRALKHYGLEIKGRQSKYRLLRDKKWLREQYVGKKKSIRDIAKEAGCTVGAAHSAIRFLGLELRKASEALGLKYPQGRFGELASNWRGGRRLANKRQGYYYVYSPTHPHCTTSGYVMEHILVAEKKIGRYLKRGEVVHHVNHIKSDNRPENLLVMTRSEHVHHHFEEGNEVARLKALVRRYEAKYGPLD